jgi:glycosyltransferase involved in cell wall biosynthesis
VRILFVKPSLVWPRSSGHDVHTYHMMKACGELGHTLGLATVTPQSPQATAGLNLAFTLCLGSSPDRPADGVRFSGLQERFRSYWGVDHKRILALRDAARTFEADAVVVAGLDALPYLPGIDRGVRIWYAADEWVWHHLSLVQVSAPATWSNIKVAVVKGLYERVYAPLIDRAWVVSRAEERAMRWFAGVQTVDVLPNGVDGDYFAPRDEAEQPGTAVFWGRLDFEPNIQALTWFCDRVWPGIREQVTDARFTIIGFQPTEEVQALARRPGIRILPNLEDLRTEVSRHALVVLPFVSGGGIKNKLLEAAALGKAVICTRRTLSGLRNPEHAGFVAVDEPREWLDAMTTLWAKKGERREAGIAARRWVLAEHSWRTTATAAVDGIAATHRGAART